MLGNMRLLGQLRPAIGACAVFFVLLGLAYPLAETGIGQALFGHQANGSLTADGSTLVGQHWTSPRWFVGRPDADNPMATGGTNLGPRSKVLVSDVAAQIALLRKEGITPTNDLVTTSGSGVDPDIAPVDAYAQVDAVAKARGLPVAAVRQLVKSQIQQPQFGFLGASYINVLQLNQALARMR
jgi:K+-transporting ATPase ATPase C chain